MLKIKLTADKDYLKEIINVDIRNGRIMMVVISTIEILMLIISILFAGSYDEYLPHYRACYIAMILLGAASMVAFYFMEKYKDKYPFHCSFGMGLISALAVAWTEWISVIDYYHFGVFSTVHYMTISASLVMFLVVEPSFLFAITLVFGIIYEYLNVYFMGVDALATGVNVFIYMTVACIAAVGKYEFNKRFFYNRVNLEKNNEELKAANQRVNEAKLEAEEANRTKSLFLANMSHEIRTPINAIMGMDEMILRETSDPAIVTYASSIETSGRNLLTLINEILDISKIESGKLEIVPENYDLVDVINLIITEMTARAGMKSIAVQFEVSPNVPSKFFGDPVRLKQIITNLMTNGIKYTEKGSVTLYINGINMESGYQMMISVIDTGIGIKEEDLEKLFLNFQRLDIHKNRSIEGTGLGLALTKQLVDMMNGSIEVQSIYGKGSNFSVTLPQAVVDWTPIGDYRVAYQNSLKVRKQYQETFVAPTARILVVDDNDMNRMVVKGLLKKTKVSIDEAENGQDAIELTRENQYHLILMDHLMPGMDGIDTLHFIRSDIENLNKATPVVVLTANAIGGVKESYIREGFAGYLSKPIEGLLLERTVAEFLPEELYTYIDDNLKQEKESDLELLKEIRNVLKGKSINLDLALRYMNNSAIEYLEIAKVYIATGIKLMPVMDEYLVNDNINDFRIKIHSVKGSSRNVGAEKLGDFAEELEISAKNGNMDYIKERYNKFKEEWKDVIETLKKLPETEKETVDEGEKVENPLELKRLSADMVEALKEYDLEKAEEYLNEIKHIKMEPEKEAALLKAQSFMDEFDYDSAILSLEEIAK